VKLSIRPRLCLPPTSAFAGFRFPPEVIVVAVCWYLRCGLSYRDVEELLVERGVEVDHVTVYRWVHWFSPLADAARFRRHSPGDRWSSMGFGGLCIGRSTSTGRSSTCWSRPVATLRLRTGSSGGR
jgi:hypothetical protein